MPTKRKLQLDKAKLLAERKKKKKGVTTTPFSPPDLMRPASEAYIKSNPSLIDLYELAPIEVERRILERRDEHTQITLSALLSYGAGMELQRHSVFTYEGTAYVIQQMQNAVRMDHTPISVSAARTVPQQDVAETIIQVEAKSIVEPRSKL